MAPIPSPSGLPPVWIAISVIGAVVFLTTLPFLATAIWLYFKDVWYVMFKDRARYLETAKLRKEWNKAHYIEERRQHIVQIGIGRLILKNNLSEKQWMLLSELVREETLAVTSASIQQSVYKSGTDQKCYLVTKVVLPCAEILPSSDHWSFTKPHMGQSQVQVVSSALSHDVIHLS